MKSQENSKEKSKEEKDLQLERLESKYLEKLNQMKNNAAIVASKVDKNKHLVSLHKRYQKDLGKQETKEKQKLERAVSAIRDHIQYLIDSKKLSEANAKDAKHELEKINKSFL